MKQTSFIDAPVERYTSTLKGTDGEALNRLLKVHAVENPIILDTTYNTGKMWKKCDYNPHFTNDIDEKRNTSFHNDFRDLVDVSDNSVDVVVFDPPYIPTDMASENASKIYIDRFGITGSNSKGSDYRTGNNIFPCFVPFLKEAKRILTSPNGIVLCKIGDLVHQNCQQWQHVEFINAAFQVGMTPCDMMILTDRTTGHYNSGAWKTVKHFRKSHVFWIVVRVTNKCVKC